jgi:hypothetical protein
MMQTVLLSRCATIKGRVWLLLWRNIFLSDDDDTIALQIDTLAPGEDGHQQRQWQIGVFSLCNQISLLLMNMSSLLPSELVRIYRAAYR